MKDNNVKKEAEAKPHMDIPQPQAPVPPFEGSEKKPQAMTCAGGAASSQESFGFAEPEAGPEQWKPLLGITEAELISLGCTRSDIDTIKSFPPPVDRAFVADFMWHYRKHSGGRVVNLMARAVRQFLAQKEGSRGKIGGPSLGGWCRVEFPGMFTLDNNLAALFLVPLLRMHPEFAEDIYIAPGSLPARLLASGWKP